MRIHPLCLTLPPNLLLFKAFVYLMKQIGGVLDIPSRSTRSRGSPLSSGLDSPSAAALHEPRRTGRLVYLLVRPLAFGDLRVLASKCGIASSIGCKGGGGRVIQTI